MQLQRPPPQPASLFTARDFLLLWGVGAMGNAVRWLEVLTAGLYTFHVTGSGLMVAVVTAGRSLPMILLGGYAGVLSEALDRKRILVGGLLIMSAASASVAVLSATGLLTPWLMLAAGIATGTVYGTEMPARRRMVAESVPPPLAPRAVAMDSMTGAMTRVAGPLLGGVAYEVLGVTASFAITAACCLLASGVATRVRWSQVTRTLSLGSATRELAEGISVVRHTPALLTVMLSTVAVNLFGFSYTSLMAPAGEHVFHVSPSLVGVLAASEPAGASLGAVMMATFGLPRGDPVWNMLGGVAVLLSMLALMPLAPGYWAACALMLLAGLGMSVFANLQTVIGLGHSPAAVRSRVMGIVSTCIGTWPIGMLLAGSLADQLGPLMALPALAVGGFIALAAIAALYARQRVVDRVT